MAPEVEAEIGEKECVHCKSLLTCICMLCQRRFCYRHSARGITGPDQSANLKESNEPFLDFLYYICMVCWASRFGRVFGLFVELSREKEATFPSIKTDPKTSLLTQTMDELTSLQETYWPLEPYCCRHEYQEDVDFSDFDSSDDEIVDDSDAAVALYVEFSRFDADLCRACKRPIHDDLQMQETYFKLRGEWPCLCARRYGCNCALTPCVCPKFDPMMRTMQANSLSLARQVLDKEEADREKYDQDLPPKKRSKMKRD